MLRARASRLGRYEYVASPRRPARTDARQRMSHRFYTSCVSTLAAAGQALWVMLVLLQLAAAAFSGLGQEPNPPVWPDSVTVFGPDDAAEANAVMTRLSTTLNDRAAGHFSDERRAFLFKPGAYEMDVAVGYYVSVHGLGASPGDVVIAGPRGIYVDAMDKRAGGAGSQAGFRGMDVTLRPPVLSSTQTSRSTIAATPTPTTFARPSRRNRACSMWTTTASTPGRGGRSVNAKSRFPSHARRTSVL